MTILVFGLGSIGARHVRILGERFSHRLPCFSHRLVAFRSGASSQSNDLGIPELRSWSEAEALRPDVALITNPTSLHIETALRCAELGMHLFIEKPLGHTMEGVDRLMDICRKRQLTCYTAYCLRFHPVIKELKGRIASRKVLHVRAVVSSYLPHWRTGQDHKKSYSAQAKLGGGVCLDLSHEFDYLAYLFGPLRVVNGWYGMVGEVTVDAEDAADIFMRTAHGVPINLHMNEMSLFPERRVIVDVDKGYFLGDLLENRLEIGSGATKAVEQFSLNRDAYYQEQLEYFFANIGNPAIMNNLEEASSLLKTILDFKQAV